MVSVNLVFISCAVLSHYRVHVSDRKIYVLMTFFKRPNPYSMSLGGSGGQSWGLMGSAHGIGAIGTPTTINSGDMAGILMIAVQALERENTQLKARLEALERLVQNRPYLTASAEPVQ